MLEMQPELIEIISWNGTPLTLTKPRKDGLSNNTISRLRRIPLHRPLLFRPLGRRLSPMDKGLPPRRLAHNLKALHRRLQSRGPRTGRRLRAARLLVQTHPQGGDMHQGSTG
jgi:hypothetical protein